MKNKQETEKNKQPTIAELKVENATLKAQLNVYEKVLDASVNELKEKVPFGFVPKEEE